MSLLRKTFVNASWLVSDRVLRLALNFAVGILIARQLGPEGFGLLSYGQVLIMLLTPLATFGMPEILVREFARGKRDPDAVLTTALVARLVAALVAVGVLAVTVMVLRNGEPAVTMVVLGYGLSFLPQAFDVVESRFQSLDRVGVLSTLRMANSVGFALARLAAVLLEQDVVVYALLYTAEIALFAVLSVLAGRRQGIRIRFTRFDRDEARYLCRASAPLMLRMLAIAIYIRIDQVLVQHILGDRAMGIYSAAVRISELWYFIPVAIVVGAAPSLTRAHEQGEVAYANELRGLIKLILALALAAALVLSFGAQWIVGLLFGEAFAGAAPVLVIQAWTGIFVAVGVASGPWFINTGMLRYGLYQTVVAAALSAALNVLLIARFGLLGAAVASLVSQATAAVLLNAVFPATRPLFALQLGALRLWPARAQQ